MCVCRWQEGEVEECKQTDVFGDVCFVCIVSEWLPDGVLLSMAGAL